jgi:type IV secretory pathway VirB2 component (pilin)
MGRQIIKAPGLMQWTSPTVAIAFVGGAFAQSVTPTAKANDSLPIVTGLACDMVRWMQGDLAVVIFCLVIVATLVIGMVGNVDWSKIISTCIIFAVVMGLLSVIGPGLQATGLDTDFLTMCTKDNAAKG